MSAPHQGCPGYRQPWNMFSVHDSSTNSANFVLMRAFTIHIRFTGNEEGIWEALKQAEVPVARNEEFSGTAERLSSEMARKTEHFHVGLGAVLKRGHIFRIRLIDRLTLIVTWSTYLTCSATHRKDMCFSHSQCLSNKCWFGIICT